MTTEELMIAILAGTPREKIAEEVFDGVGLTAASTYLLSMAEYLAETAYYLDYRGGHTGFDHGHDAAMKYAAKRIKPVRKSMGFTY